MPHRVAPLISFLVLSAFAFAPAGAYAQDGVTVRGEIVDLACYMAKGSKGTTHKACAQMCAKKGLPIGILTDKEGVFLLIADGHDSAGYETAKQLAGERVEIRGTKFSRDGAVSIAVSAVEELRSEGAANPAAVFAASRPR